MVTKTKKVNLLSGDTGSNNKLIVNLTLPHSIQKTQNCHVFFFHFFVTLLMKESWKVLRCCLWWDHWIQLWNPSGFLWDPLCAGDIRYFLLWMSMVSSRWSLRHPLTSTAISQERVNWQYCVCKIREHFAFIKSMQRILWKVSVLTSCVHNTARQRVETGPRN